MWTPTWYSRCVPPGPRWFGEGEALTGACSPGPLQLDQDDHCRSATQRATSSPEWLEDKVLLLDDLDRQVRIAVYDDEYGQGLVARNSKKKKKKQGNSEAEVNQSGDPLLARFTYPPGETK